VLIEILIENRQTAEFSESIYYNSSLDNQNFEWYDKNLLVRSFSSDHIQWLYHIPPQFNQNKSLQFAESEMASNKTESMETLNFEYAIECNKLLICKENAINF